MYSFFLPIYSFWCMDDFSWGNTRLVIGEGSNKKVLMNEDEKFDESMIPLKKFSGMYRGSHVLVLYSLLPTEYEAEAWETGTRHSDETGYSGKPQSRARPGSHSGSVSPRSHHQGNGSQVEVGDYWRDTNALGHRSSAASLRGRPSQTNLSQYGGQPVMSQYGLPQMPFMPMGGGPGSVVGSEFGHMSMVMPMGYQNTGSMYGMMPNAPRNTVMTNLNMFSGGGVDANGSQHSGLAAPMMPVAQRPMSMFSMATSVNPFAGPSMNPNPSDEDLVNALRQYLSTQDLMTVTKK